MAKDAKNILNHFSHKAVSLVPSTVVAVSTIFIFFCGFAKSAEAVLQTAMVPYHTAVCANFNIYKEL